MSALQLGLEARPPPRAPGSEAPGLITYRPRVESLHPPRVWMGGAAVQPHCPGCRRARLSPSPSWRPERPVWRCAAVPACDGEYFVVRAGSGWQIRSVRPPQAGRRKRALRRPRKEGC